MRATIGVCALAAVSACCALGEEVNVIYQHNAYYNDPHNPGYPFYTVVGPPYNTVTIFTGVEGQTFLFEATLEEHGLYQGPGDINRIVADPNAGVVTISVVGWDGHAYGARDIGEIKLDNAGVTGTIAALTISHDYGAVGPMLAHSSGPLAIGGLVRNLISVGDISGSVTIGQLGADLLFGHMQDLTVTGPTPEGYPLPNITIAGGHAYPYGMQISQAVNDVEITGEVSGQITAGSANHVTVGSLSSAGAMHITSDLSYLGVGSLAGSVTTGGNLLIAGVDSVSATGLLDVGNDLGGGDDFPLVVNDILEGTVIVRNDLLVGHDHVALDAYVSGLGSAGTLRVQRHATCDILIGYYYAPDPLPAGASVAVGLEAAGMLQGEIAVRGEVANGSITINDQDEEHCVHAYGDLGGTIRGINYLACVNVDGAILPSGSVLSDCQLVGPLSVGLGMDGTISASFVDASVTVGGTWPVF